MTEALMRCPLCYTRKAVPILYGTPTAAQIADVNAGKLHLGGRVVERDPPAWHCRKCGYEWGWVEHSS